MVSNTEITGASIVVINKRKLNPRICRGCGKVFMPDTALQRYGQPECKKLGNNYQCRAVPGKKINHEQ